MYAPGLLALRMLQLQLASTYICMSISMLRNYVNIKNSCIWKSGKVGRESGHINIHKKQPLSLLFSSIEWKARNEKIRKKAELKEESSRTIRRHKKEAGWISTTDYDFTSWNDDLQKSNNPWSSLWIVNHKVQSKQINVLLYMTPQLGTSQTARKALGHTFSSIPPTPENKIK